MTQRNQRVKHVPQHRRPARSAQLTSRVASRTAVRTVLALSSAAVVGTGVAVAGGTVALGSDPAGATAATASVLTAETDRTVAGTAAEPVAQPSEPAASPTSASATAEVEAAAALETEAEPEVDLDRSVPVSRSDRRGVADPVKAAALSLDQDNLMDRSEDSSDEDPRTIAAALLGDFGFSSDQMGCLDDLWTKESGWSATADNPSSSAYGIPQALPGSKMSSAGADWATNPVTQIRWGLGYIEDRYGSPCSAWSHSVSNNWY